MRNRLSWSAGVQTFVTEKSQKGLPTDADREKQVVLPPGSATPGGEGRDIGKFEYNTPDSDSDIKPRTLSVPGEQYGHPSNDTYNTVTRRTMTSMLLPIASYEEELYFDSEDEIDMEETAPRRRRRKNRKKRKDKGKKRSPGVKGKNWGKGVKKLKGPKKRNYKRVKKERQKGLRRASVESVVLRYLSGVKREFAPPRERGGEGGDRQKRQEPDQRRKDKVEYKSERANRQRDSRLYYHRVCKRNRKCMKRREEYRKDPARYKRKKRSGDIILYDVGSPANSEIKHPGKDVNYDADGPTTYHFTPDDREGLPKGNDVPDRHLDNVPPATSRVVPNGQYVTAGFNKSGATIDTLLSKTGREIISNSSSVSLTPFRFIPKNGFWSFKAAGSQGTYTVRIKGLGMQQGNIKSLSKATVKVSCTCPFFRWQGPEYYAKKEGYLYGKLRGSASKPKVKDPEGNKLICKHIAAALKTARGYKSASTPSAKRVADIYMEKLNHQHSGCKNEIISKYEGDLPQ